MVGMNSGVSAYQEDAVQRLERPEDKTMSDMGNVPSKYHHDSGMPFPGPDAFALAAGTLGQSEAGMIHPIKTPEDHKAALDRIDQLMDAEENSPEATELEVMAILVERYEREVFPIDPPLPEHQAKVQRAQKRAMASTVAVIDPARVEFVTSGHSRLCIDCQFCTDHDKTEPPAFLKCTRPLILKAARGAVPYCVTARSDHYGHLACGAEAEWFVDALNPHRHRDSDPE